MPLARVTRAALEVGRRQAKEILKFRGRALKRRTKALQTRSKAAKAAATAGVLVAEGDSWFDYPLHDILKMLEDDHGYDVESVAHKGDPIEEMAYGPNQLDDFTRRIEKLLRRNIVPKAVLLSGGGNDVAGTEFGMLLNHAQSAVAGLNAQVVAGVIHQRIQNAYITILSAVTSICEEKLGRRLPILVHGYDYPVPDGRGFLGGWWMLPGPWLEPGFREKGFEKLPQRIAMAQELIDHLNAMLQTVASLQPFAHVKYIDLRNTLPRDKHYKDWWANELHPTEKGFARVTDKFVTELAALP
jgi:hypothetical protein